MPNPFKPLTDKRVVYRSASGAITVTRAIGYTADWFVEGNRGVTAVIYIVTSALGYRVAFRKLKDAKEYADTCERYSHVLRD